MHIRTRLLCPYFVMSLLHPGNIGGEGDDEVTPTNVSVESQPYLLIRLLTTDAFPVLLEMRTQHI
jgi:hypothetical protein